MRILGIDWGIKRVGIAISAKDTNLALPHDTWIFSDWAKFLEKLKELIKNEDINSIVIGLPLSMDQKETKQSGIVREAALKIEGSTGLKVFFENELFTSKIAGIHSEGKIDASAAALILQSFLDKQEGKNMIK
ncbi:Holliday junction resolvase RuvX [Candidatus Parcubacteria bacterium]|nr:MAG: Holliday junction resolvase RuvX [Candidatus Parcubacteria bacterium]